jgi:hypothetical protein
MATASTRTIITTKQPYKTSGGETLYLGTSTEVQVDAAGKYIPNSAIVSLRLYTGGILGTDYKTVAIRDAGEAWKLTQDADGNVIAGADLQQTLANRNSLMNINLNNHVSNVLQAPLQGVPAGQVNTNQQSSSNAALGLPQTTGTARPDPNKPPPQDTTVNLSSISQINPDSPNPNFSDAFGISDLVYPTNIRNNSQDFIKFSVIKYEPRKLDVTGAIGILGERSQSKEILGNIILPIQPSITDTNNVDWNGLGVNPIEMELTNGSLNIMSGSGQSYVDDLVGKLTGMGKDANVINSVKLYFAQKAAGVDGLLSRVTGAVVNPNLELLFQGPTLRPFNFTFKLSPRSEAEATVVKKIIRAFKQYSAVGTASNRLFLTTPNVFNIQYVSKDNDGKESNHKSLNRIKTCALKSVNVDYTPDGSYMTFSDNTKTMTSYSLSLQFQELEPVTTGDYIDNVPYNEIGY